ncbi:hypothetical protein G7054_g1683 [Neopestalotiopsis clavispora]|nr:hypothetical protein G7054_g1683 [Neopestalotiopsis clavispora]
MVRNHQNCPLIVSRKLVKDADKYAAKSQVTFPFMSLPVELRDIVWQFAAQRRRLVGAELHSNRRIWTAIFGSIPPHCSWNTPPAIAHVCYHSRFVAFKYGQIFGTFRGYPPYFRDKIDACLYGYDGLNHQLWRNSNDVLLFKYMDQLLFTNEYMGRYCKYNEEALIACNIFTGYWEQQILDFLRALQKHPFADGKAVKIVNLYIPGTSISRTHWSKTRSLTTSPELLDKLFAYDDVKIIDLRDHAAVVAMGKYFPYTQPWRPSPVDNARRLWCTVSEKGTQSVFEALSAMLRREWLNDKLKQLDSRTQYLLRSYAELHSTKLMDTRWAKKLLKDMPELRPVFVIAKDDSWDWRKIKKKEFARSKSTIRARLGGMKQRCVEEAQEFWTTLPEKMRLSGVHGVPQFIL